MSKKLLSLLLIVALFGNCCSYAAGADLQLYASEMRMSEVNAVNEAMNFYDLAGNTTVEVLYDFQDSPAYLLGITENEYLIMDRSSQVALEWGEGNPYAGYQDTKKYYGAILNYYVDDEESAGYINLKTGDVSDRIAHISYNDADLLEYSDGEVAVIPYGKNAATTHKLAATPSKEGEISQAYTNIRKMAFPYNNGTSCSAVACTIALNYLDIMKDDGIVPDNMELKRLKGKVYNDSTYPNARRFHDYIFNTCDMGGATLPGDVANGIDNYSRRVGTRVYIDWLTVDRFDIMNDIDNDIPGLITVYTPSISTEDGSQEISWHTMLIYGYKTYSDTNIVGWKVHLGWWPEVVGSGSSAYVKEQWINPALGSCALYRFIGASVG